MFGLDFRPEGTVLVALDLGLKYDVLIRTMTLFDSSIAHDNQCTKN